MSLTGHGSQNVDRQQMNRYEGSPLFIHYSFRRYGVRGDQRPTKKGQSTKFADLQRDAPSNVARRRRGSDNGSKNSPNRHRLDDENRPKRRQRCQGDTTSTDHPVPRRRTSDGKREGLLEESAGSRPKRLSLILLLRLPHKRSRRRRR